MGMSTVVMDDIYLLFGVDVCPDGRMYLGSLDTIERLGRGRLQGYAERQKNCPVVAGAFDTAGGRQMATTGEWWWKKEVGECLSAAVDF